MGVRSDLFLDLCRNVRRGDMVRELSDALASAVKAAGNAGKAGSITLKIEFKPNGRGQMIITDTINAKEPKPNMPSTLMFCDEYGNLSRRDPNQPELGLKEAEAPAPTQEEMSNG